MILNRWAVAVALAGAAASMGCTGAGTAADTEDGIDDVGVTGDKADGSAFTGCELEHVLGFVNDTATSYTVLREAGVHAAASRHIVEHRDGEDGVAGTDDDDLFDDIEELDDTPWVGPVAFQQLVGHVAELCTLPDGESACAASHEGSTADGEDVLVCDELYAERPYVRPPADDRTAEGLSTLYVALAEHAVPGTYAIVDREGTAYALLDAAGDPVKSNDPSQLPDVLHMPSHRNLFFIYVLSGRVGEWTDDYGTTWPSFAIEDAAPAILLEGRAIDGLFTELEGTVSKRIGDSEFDPDDRVPLRITFTSLEPRSNLVVWGGGDTLEDGESFTMVGSVDNFDRSVRSSEGTCMPSLASLGDANPWKGATSSEVNLYRQAAMHFAADEVMVVLYPPGTTGLSSSGMTGLRLLHPANLLLREANESWSDNELFPHGSPNGHSLDIVPVEGGGGDCD